MKEMKTDMNECSEKKTRAAQTRRRRHQLDKKQFKRKTKQRKIQRKTFAEQYTQRKEMNMLHLR